MSGSYGEIIKNYDNLDKPKRDEGYHQKQFSPEENKKLNEIFLSRISLTVRNPFFRNISEKFDCADLIYELAYCLY